MVLERAVALLKRAVEVLERADRVLGRLRALPWYIRPMYRSNGSLYWYIGSMGRSNGSLYWYVRSLYRSNGSLYWSIYEQLARRKVAELVREIEEEAAAQRAATGKSVLGRAAILKQHLHERPARPKKSYAPLVHAVSRKVRRDLYEGTAPSSPPTGKRRRSCEPATAP